MSEPRAEQLTAEQRAALEAELAELEGPKRKEAVQAIKTAREFGDLSENFEYHAAKNEQGLLEARIRASSRPCSFFAAWYSKFSERSPNSRAVLIACTASFRFGPSSSASSASRAARCSAVSCSARGSLIETER